jgi:glutamyl-tRNA synthetase
VNLRVRFAPSPTGSLHIGNARTALFNWLHARKHGGRFILRIEDTDRERSRPEWEAAILEDLKWLGLHWDEGPDVSGSAGPYRQSERLPSYQAAADRLLGEGMAYFCFCSPQGLLAQRQERLARSLPPRYDGRCRAIPAEEAARRRRSGEAAAVRFVMPSDRITVHDLVKGDVEFLGSDLDDFVILRADGSPSYNFAAPLDDHAMGITLVIRGDDHLANTPRQMAVARALGWESPQFAHVPLIHGADGAPLSKRHGAVSVAEHRAAGILPEALVNYLALLGWSPPSGADEVQDLSTLSRLFVLDRVSRAPARYDAERLAWFNRQHLRRLPAERVLALIEPIPRDDLTERAVEVLSKEVDSLGALKRVIAEIRAEPGPGSLRLTTADRRLLEALDKALASGAVDTADDARHVLDGVCRDLPGSKREFMHAARLALMGSPEGLPVATLLWILGSERAQRRLARALAAPGGS